MATKVIQNRYYNSETLQATFDAYKSTSTAIEFENCFFGLAKPVFDRGVSWGTRDTSCTIHFDSDKQHDFGVFSGDPPSTAATSTATAYGANCAKCNLRNEYTETRKDYVCFECRGR